MARKKVAAEYSGKITENMLNVWLSASLGNIELSKQIATMMFMDNITAKDGAGLTVFNAPGLVVTGDIADRIIEMQNTKSPNLGLLKR